MKSSRTPPPGRGKDAPPADAPRQLALGLGFGIVFGFLLQKGGVAKYEILMGALLLTDFTVMKIIVTAIAVGMVGVFALHRLGLVELHVKPTRYAGNIAGGLLFGAGFALAGYCPGTGAAAMGQGNWDAVVMVLGMITGSHVYAEASHAMDESILRVGNRGGLMLPDLVGVRILGFVLVFAPLLVAALFLMERYAP